MREDALNALDQLKELSNFKEPDPQAVIKLFMQSFRHSQGAPTFQAYLFSYMSYLHPDWHISTAFTKKLEESLLDTMQSMIGPDSKKGITHGKIRNEVKDIKEEIDSQLNNFKENINQPKDFTKEEERQELLTAPIERDYTYTIHRTGRPGRDLDYSGPPDVQKDPWFSYFCFYGLEGHSTGVMELDRFYQDSVAYYRELVAEKGVKEKPWMMEQVYKMQAVVSKYYEKHPMLTKSAQAESLLTNF